MWLVNLLWSTILRACVLRACIIFDLMQGNIYHRGIFYLVLTERIFSESAPSQSWEALRGSRDKSHSTTGLRVGHSSTKYASMAWRGLDYILHHHVHRVSCIMYHVLSWHVSCQFVIRNCHHKLSSKVIQQWTITCHGISNVDLVQIQIFKYSKFK